MDPDKLRENFYLHLDDFSIFKLRSTIFLINFPITYTIAVIACWYKTIPDNPTKGEGYSIHELEEIAEVKQAIRDLIRNLGDLLQNLLDYLKDVKDAGNIRANFNLITHSYEFQDFKSTFFNTKGCTFLGE